MNKFWWSVIMIAAIVIIAIIDIKTMPIWVVIVNVALGIVAAFEIVILLNYGVMVTHKILVLGFLVRVQMVQLILIIKFILL